MSTKQTFSVLILFILFCLSACTKTQGNGNEDKIKSTITMAYENLNKRDFTNFKTACADDFIDYTAGPSPVKGIDACIEAYKGYFEMFPDMKIEVEKITVSGNQVYVETKSTGTNTGKVMGMLPPTGKSFKINEIETIVVDDNGKAISHKTANPNDIFYQIGYGALVNPNTSTIMSMYEKFGKGDIAGLTALCADNVHWDITDNPFVKKPIVYKSNKELPQFFGDLMSSGEVTKFDPYKFTADGDDVLSLVNVGFKGKDGKIKNSTFAHHFHFSNGKVVAFKEITTNPVQ